MSLELNPFDPATYKIIDVLRAVPGVGQDPEFLTVIYENVFGTEHLRGLPPGVPRTHEIVQRLDKAIQFTLGEIAADYGVRARSKDSMRAVVTAIDLGYNRVVASIFNPERRADIATQYVDYLDHPFHRACVNGMTHIPALLMRYGYDLISNPGLAILHASRLDLVEVMAESPRGAEWLRQSISGSRVRQSPQRYIVPDGRRDTRVRLPQAPQLRALQRAVEPCALLAHTAAGAL